MSGYFFDTSALVKFYHSEKGTERVSATFAQADRKIKISALGLVELYSAFAMKVRTGVIDRTTVTALRTRVLADIEAENFEVHQLMGSHLVSAGQLILRHSFSKRLRTLDALQLAVALDLADQQVVNYFVTADAALAEVAVLEGLSVINPEIS